MSDYCLNCIPALYGVFLLAAGEFFLPANHSGALPVRAVRLSHAVRRPGTRRALSPLIPASLPAF